MNDKKKPYSECADCCFWKGECTNTLRKEFRMRSKQCAFFAQKS